MTLVSLLDVEIEKRKRAKIKAYGNNLYDFLKYTFRGYKRSNWHHELLCKYYQLAIERKIPKLMVFAPPRHMKTEGCQRALSYALGKDENEKLITCGYGIVKARKISTKINENIKDELFKQIFPKYRDIKFVVDQKSEWSFKAPLLGQCLAAGVDGGITGEGFTIGYIDDPYKSRKEADSETVNNSTIEWYYGTFLTRQDEMDAAIIYTSTRWRSDDLAGTILQNEGIKLYNGRVPGEGCPDWNGQSDGKWVVINLAAEMDEEAFEWKHEEDPRGIGEALWSERFPMSHLIQFKNNKYDWDSQYQGRPSSKEGSIIKRYWFKEGKFNDINFNFCTIIRFWDIAATKKNQANNPDFTAGVLICMFENDFFILDVKTIRDTPQKTTSFFQAVASEDKDLYKEKVLQVWEEQPAAAGKFMNSFMQNIFRQYPYASMAVKEDKNFYIEYHFANRLEAGNIFYIKNHWVNEKHDSLTFFDECTSYPQARHDDRIDAAAKGCYYLQNKMNGVNKGNRFELI